MTHTVLKRDEMECLYKGNFNSFYRVPTAAGPREMAAHNENKSNLLAAKMMVICLNEGAPLVQERNPLNTLPSFLETLHRTGIENFSTLILAADRPVTYFSYPMELTANYQIEIPGGVSEGDEDTLITALRETVEEYGLDGEQDIIQTAPLVTFPAANDAGTNAELYTTRLALVRKRAQPPRREGIIPEACWFGPLTGAQQYLFEQGHKGIVIEWLALASIFHLGLVLHGGWNKLPRGLLDKAGLPDADTLLNREVSYQYFVFDNDFNETILCPFDQVFRVKRVEQDQQEVRLYPTKPCGISHVYIRQDNDGGISIGHPGFQEDRLAKARGHITVMTVESPLLTKK